jgi:hypothetical protein
MSEQKGKIIPFFYWANDGKTKSGKVKYVESAGITIHNLRDKELKTMNLPNTVVLKGIKRFSIIVDYPLKTEATVNVTVKNAQKGVTRIQLLRTISQIYQELYRQDVQSKHGREDVRGIWGFYGHEVDHLEITKATYYSSSRILKLSVETG